MPMYEHMYNTFEQRPPFGVAVHGNSVYCKSVNVCVCVCVCVDSCDADERLAVYYYCGIRQHQPEPLYWERRRLKWWKQVSMSTICYQFLLKWLFTQH